MKSLSRPAARPAPLPSRPLNPKQVLWQLLQLLPLPSPHILQLISVQGAKIAELRLQAAFQSTALAQYQADNPALVGSIISEAIAVQVTPHLELLRDTCEELKTIMDGNHSTSTSQFVDIMAFLKTNQGTNTSPCATFSSSASRSPRAQVSPMEPCLRTLQ